MLSKPVNLGGCFPLTHYTILFTYHVSEMLKNSKGNYTDEHVQRCSQVCGDMSSKIDRICHYDIGGIYQIAKKDEKHTNTELVQKFVKVYSRDKLFDLIPGRQHDAFAKFKYCVGIPRPAHFKARLLKYSRKMDRDYDLQEVKGT
jgi:hypothetical protein